MSDTKDVLSAHISELQSCLSRAEGVIADRHHQIDEIDVSYLLDTGMRLSELIGRAEGYAKGNRRRLQAILAVAAE